MSYLGVLRDSFENYCHISNQPPRICLIAKFGGKTRILKLGTKNASSECFWVRISENYWHI